MTGFGEKMRREREMRGVSLEEISESTKIGTRSLRALEDEDFEKLPGGIFNKGFVRAYSRFLGLDEDQAVADFDAAWREQQAAKEPFPETLLELQQETPEPSSKLPVAIVATVLLAIFAGGYGLKHFLAARAESKQSVQLEAEQMKSSPSSAQVQPGTPEQSPVSELAVSSQAKTEPSQSKSQEATTAAPAKTPPTPVEGQKLAATDVPSASTSSAPILLEVIAHEDSWLSVSADGKSLGQGILNAQKSRTIRANKEVRLRVGNVAGVEVSFNGKPVNIDGEPKQVKELTFTPEGLRQ